MSLLRIIVLSLIVAGVLGAVTASLLFFLGPSESPEPTSPGLASSAVPRLLKPPPIPYLEFLWVADVIWDEPRIVLKTWLDPVDHNGTAYNSNRRVEYDLVLPIVASDDSLKSKWEQYRGRLITLLPDNTPGLQSKTPEIRVVKWRRLLVREAQIATSNWRKLLPADLYDRKMRIRRYRTWEILTKNPATIPYRSLLKIIDRKHWTYATGSFLTMQAIDYEKPANWYLLRIWGSGKQRKVKPIGGNHLLLIRLRKVPEAGLFPSNCRLSETATRRFVIEIPDQETIIPVSLGRRHDGGPL